MWPRQGMVRGSRAPAEYSGYSAGTALLGEGSRTRLGHAGSHGAAAQALPRRAGREAARACALRAEAVPADALAVVGGGHARATAFPRATHEVVSRATGGRRLRQTWRGEAEGGGKGKDEDGQAQQISGHDVSFIRHCTGNEGGGGCVRASEMQRIVPLHTKDGANRGGGGTKGVGAE